MNNPSKTFVDGSNQVWVASSGANTVSALNVSTGNWLATNGFSTDAPGGTGCSVIGVDPSGNVWSGNADQSVTELLGLGAPTAAPLYAGMTVITGTAKTITKGNLGLEP
jgi:DNA-binding beta-propeller fold protein YncE